jgi:hypothetical protein
MTTIGTDDISWLVDGTLVSNGQAVRCGPTWDRHNVVMTDMHGNELDSVTVEVRGAKSP